MVEASIKTHAFLVWPTTTGQPPQVKECTVMTSEQATARLVGRFFSQDQHLVIYVKLHGPFIQDPKSLPVSDVETVLDARTGSLLMWGPSSP
jgi:hypothetical protein